MTRPLDTETKEQIESRQVKLAVFLRAEFDSGVVALWSGAGPMQWDGTEYIGAGSILSVDQVAEATETVARGVSITLTGLDPEILNLAYAEEYQGRPFVMSLGFLDADRQIVGSPLPVFAGFMDVFNDLDDAETVKLKLTVENALVALERPPARTYTAEDQKERSTGDTFFDYVADVQNREIRLD